MNKCPIKRVEKNSREYKATNTNTHRKKNDNLKWVKWGKQASK